METSMDNKTKKAKKIIDAAETLFFEKGYDKTSMSGIAQEAMVAKGTLYLYFQNKRELYYAVGKRALDVLIAMFQKSSAACHNGLEKIIAFGRAFAEYQRIYPEYYDFIIDYQGEKIKLKKAGKELKHTFEDSHKLFSMLIEVVREGQQDGSILLKMAPELLAGILWCQTNGIVQLADLREPFFMQYSKDLNAENLVESYLKLNEQIMKNGIC